MTLMLIIVAIVFAVIFFTSKNKAAEPVVEQEVTPKYQYKQKALMTENEFEFFNRLVQALPNYYVFPQVSMGAVLQGDGPNKMASRGTFAQKIIDYTICNKQGKIIAIIELDDKTHVKEKDEKRDNMLTQVGYRTIRFNSKSKPSIEEIKKAIG